MRLLNAFALLVVSAMLAGASSKDDKKQKKPPEPTPLEKYINEALRDRSSPDSAHPAGSIWSPNGLFSNLGMDLKASRVNDLVTIVVNENTAAAATGDVKTGRTSAAQSNITALAGKKSPANALANLLGTSTATSLQGTGETSRGTTLTATVSARITNVLPNGYLVVEGVKRVQVNSENQVITVRGVIRTFDLDLTNSILSDRVAQMELQVNGKGVVQDSIHRPNFLYRLLLGLLPF